MTKTSPAINSDIVALADAYMTASQKDQTHAATFNYTNKGYAAAAGRKMNKLAAAARSQNVRMDVDFWNEVRRLTGRS